MAFVEFHSAGVSSEAKAFTINTDEISELQPGTTGAVLIRKNGHISVLQESYRYAHDLLQGKVTKSSFAYREM